MTYQERLKEQAERAMQVHDAHCCPHCRAPLTAKDTLFLSHGDGTVKKFMVEIENGTRLVMRDCDINPQAVLVDD
jgi:hypothetical protein